MKKMFFAALAMMCSSLAFAQVETDSTSGSDNATDTTQSAIGTDTTHSVDSTSMSTDTTSQSGQGQVTDTTAQTAVSGDTTAVGSAGATGAITDDDLRKYAVIMDSVNGMKKTLLADITALVKGNAKVTTARYNELSKAAGDQAKLQELKASPDEIAFVQQVTDKKNQGAQQISETFQTMARDYIGVDVYNKVKTALETDTDLQTRYQSIMTEVENQGTASSR